MLQSTQLCVCVENGHRLQTPETCISKFLLLIFGYKVIVVISQTLKLCVDTFVRLLVYCRCLVN